jgi:hypothetical protein
LAGAFWANFAEPVVTTTGEDAAMLVHNMLVAKLHDMLGLDRDAAKASQSVA